MARLSLRLLGGFEAEAGGRPLAIPSKKVQALLAYVALSAGQVVTRDAAAGLLWGDVPSDQAHDSLRQALAALRKALGPARSVLVGGRADIALKPGGTEVDALAFEAALSGRGKSDVARAVQLYRGDLLAGLVVRETAFEEWLAGERTRLGERALIAMDALLEQQASKEPAAAVETASRLLTLDPLRESGHRALMRIYAAAGRPSAAIRQYQLCAAVLKRELGVQPDPATRDLYLEILRAQGAAGTRERAGDRSAIADAPEPPVHDTPLVGRATELSVLREALTAATEGRGQALAVLGEAGIGKSRLVAELMVEGRRAGATLLVGHCHDPEQIVPLGPWTDIVRQALAVVEARTLAPECRAELAGLVPGIDHAPVPERGSRDDARRLFQAVTQLLDAVAARRPLVLVVEDVHWADDLSARLMSFVARRLSAAPALLVATIRTEEIADAPVLGRVLVALDREHRLVRVTLGALSRDETATLVRSLAGRRGGRNVERLSEKVWTVSRGQPFIAVETMRAVLDGALDPTAHAETPPRVQDLVASRLGRLGERARSLTALAAVIGRPFDFALLHHAAGVSEGEAALGVEELARRQVLGTSGSQLDFTHNRIREVAYAQILPPVRRALHAAVARAVETHHASDLTPHWAALGLHYRESEAWERAVDCYARAAHHAASREAHREAAALAEAALSALGRLSDTRERLERRLELLVTLRLSLVMLADASRLERCLDEAERIAATLGDRRQLGWIASYRAGHAILVLDPERAIEAAGRALAIADEVGDARLRLYAHSRLIQVYIDVGDSRRTVETARAILAARADGGFEEDIDTVVCRCYMAGALSDLGDFAAANATAAEALAVATALGHQYATACARYGVGVVLMFQGRLDEALPHLEAGLALSRAREFGYVLPFFHSCLGITHVLAGRPAEGIPLLETAVAEAEAGGITLWLALHLIRLGEAYLRTGRIAEARALAERALEHTTRRREGKHHGWTLRLLGDIAIAEADEEGERYYREAIALARDAGMRPLEAYCSLGVGRLYHALGKADAARDALEAAIRLFGDIDMQATRAEAEKELAGLVESRRSTADASGSPGIARSRGRP